MKTASLGRARIAAAAALWMGCGGEPAKPSLPPPAAGVTHAEPNDADDRARGDGLRGDPDAIADCRAMVERMGGAETWRDLESLHFVHRWYPVDRLDTYVENEILDLTGPRSRADRKSESSHEIRAYSPEGKYWRLNNGSFQQGSDEILKAALDRAPFNFYRLVRAVAVDDSFYEVRYAESDIPETKQIDFYGPDGVLRGWVILNANSEPVVKATPEYRYTLGPLESYGALRIPRWGVYDTGYTRYEMISVQGGQDAPPISLFLPPEGATADPQLDSH